MSDIELPDWPCACGGPAGEAWLRSEPEDFFVDERLGFEPDGDGQQVWLRLEKRNANTAWIAGRIAGLAGVREGEVGYSGLKDRRAVTRQWFSVAPKGGIEPDWRRLESDEVRLLESRRSQRKLRRGEHLANGFRLRLRRFVGDRDRCTALLSDIALKGYPNYFGEQRFGTDNANLSGARQWFAGGVRPKRSEQGYWLSAVRAWLFNRVLARRVEMGNWDLPLPGDLVISSDASRCFPVFKIDDAIRQAVARLELHPTGPLYGTGEPRPSREAGEIEKAVLAEEGIWTQGLDRQRMRPERRTLRAVAQGLEWAFEGGDLTLAFELPPGAYATVLLREVVRYQTPAGSE